MDPNALCQCRGPHHNVPQVGRAWGRYWLDIAPYGDNKGPVGKPLAIPRLPLFPHLSTITVIRAFNEDLPYDRFIREQLRGQNSPLGRQIAGWLRSGFSRSAIVSTTRLRHHRRPPPRRLQEHHGHDRHLRALCTTQALLYRPKITTRAHRRLCQFPRAEGSPTLEAPKDTRLSRISAKN